MLRHMRRFPLSIRTRLNKTVPPGESFGDIYFRYLLKYSLPLGTALYGSYCWLAIPVVGRSMSPQFNPNFADHGDTVVYIPRISKQKNLKRGKIYLFNDPNVNPENMQEHDTEYVIKRCIAIEGDTVLYQKDEEIKEVLVPAGHAWLESDNHNFQGGKFPDSLQFGPIPNEEVWGHVIWCVRRNSLFPTVLPRIENYNWNVTLDDALPHQRIIFSRDILNHEMKGIHGMKNLPNKMGMGKLPIGPADRALQNMSLEDKQGYTNRHDFSLESDKKYLAKLRKVKEEEVESLEQEKLVPGMSFTTASKPANQSQYPNLN